MGAVPTASSGSQKRSPATIAEVAGQAGVGASTVSRVLNGGQVSERAKARVLAAMEDLAYRPSASARSLVTGTTGTLALVIPFCTHPSASERMRGVLRRRRRDRLRGRRLQRRHAGQPRRLPRPADAAGPQRRHADRVALAHRRGGRGVHALGRPRRPARRLPPAAAVDPHRRRRGRPARDPASDRARAPAHRVRGRPAGSRVRLHGERPAARRLPARAARRGAARRARAGARGAARAAGGASADARAAVPRLAADRDLRRLGHAGARCDRGRPRRRAPRARGHLGDRLRRRRGGGVRRVDDRAPAARGQRPPRAGPPRRRAARRGDRGARGAARAVAPGPAHAPRRRRTCRRGSTSGPSPVPTSR